MLRAFFDVKLRKVDILENETIELFVRLRTSSLSFSLISQTEFTAFDKSLINREVPPLFKCDLLLLRQVLSMLLLFIKIIPLLLHKFSSFLLVSLILSSKLWSLQWIILDNAFLCYHRCRTLSLRKLLSCFLKGIHIILDIVCSSMNNDQSRLFSNSGLT